MMQRTLQRRQALSWLLAGGSAALLIGCGGGSDEMGRPNDPGNGSDDCIANASETNGPFPSDGSNTVNGVEVERVAGIGRGAK